MSGGAKVGTNCRLHVCMSIATQAGAANDAPQIGNNVYIGPGAKLFGPIEIADRVAIGANAVVNKSFTEPNISIEGVPAAKISKKGSEGLLVRATGKKGEGEFLSLKKKSNSMTIPRFYKKRLILALLALITLLILTHIPQKNMPYQFGRLNRDKVVHAIAYGILTTLFILAIRPPRRWVSYACLLAVFIVIAALDERTQAYVGRTVSSMDWAANIVGVLTTMIISLLLKRKKLIKKPQPDKRVLSQSVADSREATFLDAT